MKHVLLFSVLGGALVLFAAAPAEAQSKRIRDSNWRQHDRSGAARRESVQRFAFELRGGVYYPAIDEEFNGPRPYHDFFGDRSRFAFGIEFDWQALRIPWVGTVGPGLGVGFTTATGPGYREGTYGKTGLAYDYQRVGEVSLSILPMYLSAVVRFDEIHRRTGVPIVPYGKIGLGVGLWWADAGGETATSKGADGAEFLGRGTSYGLHWALGGMLALDWLGRRGMAALDQETGINHVYLFGEWMNQNLGLGSGQMHVGTSTWMAGIAMEM
jgi:hypothetical protein